MGCSQSISAAIADTKVSSGLKKIDIFPESISGECCWRGSLVVTVHRRGLSSHSWTGPCGSEPNTTRFSFLASSSLSPVNNNNKSRLEQSAGASAAEQETTTSGLTRGNSSDSLPSNCTTNNNNNIQHHHGLNDAATPPSPVKATHHFDIDEAAESQLKDCSVALFGTNNHHNAVNASASTTEGTATPPSPVKATHHFDIDEAVASQLKDRSVALFGHNKKKNKDDDDDEDDPFADDSSAVFEVDEDFLLLDDCDNLSTTSVQDALRGLTLDARMSLVELVRSNSVGHLMTA
jgi:hypothetical protein